MGASKEGIADQSGHNPALDDEEIGGQHGTKLVANAALSQATALQNPSLFTKNMFLLYGCLLVATLNSCINGYDGSLMGAINSYPQYRTYFGFPVDKGTPSTGIVYAIYTIGNIVGSFAAGPASDFRGRRYGMFIGALVIVIGTCVQASSHDLAAFMIGRFILGFGVAISTTAGPAYVSEMAHPSYRGLMTGLYNTFWYIGGVPGTFVPYGTSTISGASAWRIPIWLQMSFSGIVLVFSLFLPETPRWLMAHDKTEEALDIMARYHGEGDRQSPIVQLEYQEMRHESIMPVVPGPSAGTCSRMLIHLTVDISTTGSDKRWWDYRELFNSRDVRYRTMLVFAMAFFGQWSGNGPVSYYYPQMLQGAGITDNNTRLLYNGCQNVVSFGGAVFGAVFTDAWGRRPQLLVSTGIIVAIFCIVTAINATNVYAGPDGTLLAKSSSASKAEIALIFIFGFVISAGYTPLQALYPVEILRYESRAKGMGFYNFWVNIASFYNTFVTGIAFTDAGWKYYFLFIFWDIFEFVFIYFFFVETKNRTLEELTEIFAAKKPVKFSLQKTEVEVISDEKGRVVHEVVEHPPSEALETI